MANYTERFEYKLEIVPPHYIIQCREATIIEKDGVEVGTSYNRTTYVPGSDTSAACDEVKKAAETFWTPAVISAYQDSLPPVEA